MAPAITRSLAARAKTCCSGANGNATYSSGLIADVASINPSNGGADTITGGSGIDLIIGGPGKNRLTAKGTSDVVIGSDGSASFSAGLITAASTIDPTTGGADTITAGSGNDVLIGGFGPDTITGGSGNNVIIGHGGSVQISHGLVTYATTDPSKGNPTSITAGTGTILVMGGTGVNTIKGGSGDSVLLGANGTATFANGQILSVTSTSPTVGGNDAITAGSGTTLIIGGPGNNTLTGSTGSDVILGANGSIATTGGAASIFTASTIRSTYPGTGGTDTITGGSGTQVLIGGPGNDTITGGSGKDLIFGGDAQLTLSGSTVVADVSIDVGSTGGGTDVIHAGTGNATIYGGPGNATIYGGPGTDTITGGVTVSGGASGFDQILGATATDTLGFDFTSGLPAGSHPTFVFQDSTDFTTGIPSPFSVKSGSWSLASSTYQGTATGGQAISIFSVSSTQSTYEQLQASVNTTTTAGLVYDYISSTSFKFAAMNPQTGQLILGHATATGLVNDAVASKGVRSGQDTLLGLVLSGSSATLYLNGASAVQETYSGSSLAAGGLGLFTSGGTGRFTDFVVRGNALSSTNAGLAVRSLIAPLSLDSTDTAASTSSPSSGSDATVTPPAGPTTLIAAAAVSDVTGTVASDNLADAPAAQAAPNAVPAANAIDSTVGQSIAPNESGHSHGKHKHRPTRIAHRVNPSIQPRSLARHIVTASRSASDLFIPVHTHAH